MMAASPTPSHLHDRRNIAATCPVDRTHLIPQLFRAEDLDEVGRYARVGGWQIGAMQTTPGALACTRRELILEGMQWLDEDVRNVSLSMFGDPPVESIVFGVVLHGGPTMRINGQSWRSCEIAVGSGSGPTEVLLPPGRIVTLAVKRDLLAEHLRLSDGVSLRDCGLAAPFILVRNRPLVEATRTRLARLADDVATQFQTEPMSQAQGHALRSEILALLAHVMVSTESVRADRVAMRRSLQLEVVRQARRCIAECAEDAPQVEDLCRATRVSRRTLQRCFVNVVGVTPVHYLRLSRLTDARSMLLAATPGQRIQDVLGRLGIWHASRFAAEYRALFGELPSATLHGRCRH